MGDIVLIVDDEPDITRLLADEFRERGYASLEAHDASEALSLLEKTRDIKMIVTDIKMPGQDGLELIEEVRKRDQQVSIIVLTGFVSADVVQQAKKLGANGHLGKPMQDKEIDEVVRRFLKKAA